MEIRLTPDQEDHIAMLAAQAGRSVDEVVVEALAAWAERKTALSAFRATLDAAEDSIADGQGRLVTPESARNLAEDVKRRGRARFGG